MILLPTLSFLQSLVWVDTWQFWLLIPAGCWIHYSLSWPELKLSETRGQESTSPPLLHHLLLSTIKIVSFSWAETTNDRPIVLIKNITIIQHKMEMIKNCSPKMSGWQELLLKISLKISLIKSYLSFWGGASKTGCWGPLWEYQDAMQGRIL